MRPTMRISVIVPVRDGGGAFRACLASLAACEPSAHELIVVVDGADGDSADLASAFGANVVQLLSTVGPARARNVGAASASGDALLFVDADIVVPPSLIGRVAAHLQSAPDVAAVIGSYDDAPADPGFLSQYRNLLHHYVHQTGREDASTFWCGCGAIRRAVFLDAHGFNGGFSDPSIEDIEFGYRLRRAGFRIRLAKDLQVTHLKRWLPLLLLRTDIFARAVPWTRLIIQSRTLPNDLNVRTSSRASVALVFALTVALAASPWVRGSGAVAILAAIGLMAANAGFYRFLWRVRGPSFTLAALPWHWMYFACAGLGFMMGAGQELVGRLSPTPEIAPNPEDT
jgi:glycosyltransferase involved in cell wall biosynthesis